LCFWNEKKEEEKKIADITKFFLSPSLPSFNLQTTTTSTIMFDNLKENLLSIGDNPQGFLDADYFERMKRVMGQYYKMSINEIADVAILFQSSIYRLEVLLLLLSPSRLSSPSVSDLHIRYFVDIILEATNQCKLEFIRFLIATPSILITDVEFVGVSRFITGDNVCFREVSSLIKDFAFSVRDKGLRELPNTIFIRRFGLDVKETPPLEKALEKEEKEVADSRMSDEEFLYRACLQGQLKRVTNMLAVMNPSFNVNWNLSARMKTFLHAACLSENTHIVSLILALPKIDVNARDTDNFSAFSRACRVYSFEVIFLLLQDPRVEIRYLDRIDDFPFITSQNNRETKMIVEMIIASGRHCLLGHYAPDFPGKNNIYAQSIINLINEFKKDPVETRLKIFRRSNRCK
jgi:hypothetical protein